MIIHNYELKASSFISTSDVTIELRKHERLLLMMIVKSCESYIGFKNKKLWMYGCMYGCMDVWMDG